MNVFRPQAFDIHAIYSKAVGKQGVWQWNRGSLPVERPSGLSDSGDKESETVRGADRHVQAGTRIGF